MNNQKLSNARKNASVVDTLAAITPIGALFIMDAQKVTDAIFFSMAGITFAYFLFGDSFNGQSIGKRIFKIAVFKKGNDHRASALECFKRNLLPWSPLVALITIILILNSIPATKLWMESAGESFGPILGAVAAMVLLVSLYMGYSMQDDVIGTELKFVNIPENKE